MAKAAFAATSAVAALAAEVDERRLAQVLVALQQQLVGGSRPAPAVALAFVREYAPAKFELLSARADQAGPSRQRRAGPGGEEASRPPKGLLARVLAGERRLLEEITQRSIQKVPSPHAYCSRTWLVAIIADCLGHLSATLQLEGHGGQWRGQRSEDFWTLDPDVAGCGITLARTPAVAGGVQRAWLNPEAPREANVTEVLSPPRAGEMRWLMDSIEHSQCLIEEVVFSVACALSRLVELDGRPGSGRDAREGFSQAAAFFEDAALKLLLCDGCRSDGRGLSVIPLDQILWTLGFLRHAAREGAEGSPGDAYTAAVARFRLQPVSWWRGDGDERELFGRPRLCPTAIRGLCAAQGSLWSARFAGEPKEPRAYVLPSCQLDHEPADFTSVGVLDESFDEDPCSWRSPDIVGLFLPINLGALNSLSHLTDAFTWLLPALAWIHGSRRVERLLSALWRRGRLPGPAPRRLSAESVEVILVPHHGSDDGPANAERRKTVAPYQSWLREVFPLLSTRSFRTLDEAADECVCFAAAIWGYVEPSLRMHGDVGRHFSTRLRAALGDRFRSGGVVGGATAAAGSSARTGMLHRLVAAGFRVEPAPSQVPQVAGRVGVLLSYRTTSLKHTVERTLSNHAQLSNALVAMVDGVPPLQHMEGPWENLPLADQVRLALDRVEIMIQPFGAGLAWSALLPIGSYVIELQEDGVASANFVSCFSPWPTDGGSRADDENPWWPPTNPRSEWGAWALMNSISFACVSRRPTPGHCVRQFFPTVWDTPTIDADIPVVVRLVADAARRLRGREEVRTASDGSPVPATDDTGHDNADAVAEGLLGVPATEEGDVS